VKIKLDKTFPLSASPESAWAFLQDIEAVATCMPGAQLTEQIDATRHKGTVTVRIGPATMSFKGSIEVRDVDQDARRLRLIGKGTDATGNSGASLDLTASIESLADGSTALIGASEVSMSGKAAAFGGRMMTTIAEQVLQQFAANVAAAVAAQPDARSQPPKPELNALALAWNVVWDWLRGLFGAKTS